ncbi:uncharacterized protein BT62DRAFT_919047 [Guyanagaster necrorhizus]|uniref:Uncharacterized protein n=1 Tax=Guyanagaster necrorhizus TaxID=856835 RepID=A0A9P8AVF5_9AGAR|nr:uncharacterized protein BT62DRAFT_919047 [Guyanagaster necrorhizus MCA 3950]KAG7447862.1 hypothetical protein BT62DRAFT_919047 [Guyanagaster necrorhizus MCA 3950]
MPFNATVLSSNLIMSLDSGNGQGRSGGHPVSLVLNCENYEFMAYASREDIIMQDTYISGNNVTFSSEWDTDILTREDEFWERIFINGWELSKVVWEVLQAFGDESKEFIVQNIVGINYGALGNYWLLLIVYKDIDLAYVLYSSASALVLFLLKITVFILNPKVKFQQVMTSDWIDVGIAELVAEQVLDSGAQVIVGDFRVILESVGSVVFIVPSK